MPFHEDNVREISRKIDRQSTITRPYEPLKKARVVTSKRPMQTTRPHGTGSSRRCNPPSSGGAKPAYCFTPSA